MTTLKVGIASYQDMKARTLAITRGEHRPEPDEPKIWFTSLDSFSRVLSDRNRELLALIIEAQPASLAELASLSGRAKSNLSRTLKTLERYGLVKLRRVRGGRVVPEVPYSDITLDVHISAAQSDNRAEVA